jgi:hypothetical protein
MLTAAYAVLFYAVSILLAVGLAHKIWQYAKTPASSVS